MVDMKYEQTKQHNEEFLQWLSPSYWLVESQLSSFRQQRSEGTLQWARNMHEFQAWRLSELHENAERRITWINGTLGMGKSIMAGYFIDLLKIQYPSAVVAYFFCRSNQPGLTNARDILRTLAYQCIEKDKEARKVLETLKSKGFQLTDNLSIRYLFEKLLLDPLRNSPEIFIVLDGLDEADMATQEHTDRAGRPELHVLLTCLAKLPSTRLLCISRPSAKVSDVIRNAFPKPIGKDDNAEDIDSYVRKTVDESKTLKAQFKASYTDPILYFREKGSGIFLWVVLVLQQLPKAKSRSDFQKYLDGFSAASGSMEALYSSILSRIAKEDEKWVNEILRWLVVAGRLLSVKELKSLVEWCLQDELVIDFRQFLETDCGSILQFLPAGKQVEEVRLIHETFRSFVVNPERCPKTFYIEEKQTHGYLALKCIQRLKEGSGIDDSSNYATYFWVHHLSKATSTQQSPKLLVAVYRLFTSEGLRIWVRGLCSRVSVQGLRVSHELSYVRTIHEWLCSCSLNCDDPDVETQTANEWCGVVVRNDSMLGEAIGKAAGTMWLHETHDSLTVLNCFSLALKYYWKRGNRSRSNLEELQDLIASNFRSILAWVAQHELKTPVIQRNIGLAFFTLYRWDDCIRCLTIEDDFSNDNWRQFGKYLVYTFMYKREYERAVAVVDKHCRTSYSLVLQAYRGKGDYDGAIKTLQVELDRQPSWDCFDSLLSAYRGNGDYDAAIKQLEIALRSNEYEDKRAYLLGSIYSIYENRGDYTTAVNAFRTEVDTYPKECHTWHYLGYAYRDSGDYDRAINALQLGINKTSCEVLFGDIAKLHIGKCNYDEAIEVIKASFESQSRASYVNIDHLVEAYKSKCDHDGLIKELENFVEKNISMYQMSKLLADALLEKKDYDRAIKVLKTAMKVASLSSYELGELFWRQFDAYRAKGDYCEAVRIFEMRIKSEDRSVWAAWSRQSNVLEVYEAIGNYEGAVIAFEAIVSGAGSWAWPALMMAYAKKGDLAGATQKFESAVDEAQIEPVSGVVLRSLGHLQSERR